MMIKKWSVQVAALALAVIFISSCKKDSSSGVDIKTNVVGNWKATGLSIDGNHNGTIEANEVMPTDTAWAHQIYTFAADGTYTNTYYTDVSVGSWQLLNNNATLKRVDSTNIPPVVYEQVLQFTGTTMQLKDTSLGVVSILTYAKQ